MLNDLLARLAAEMRRYGSEPQPAAASAELHNLESQAMTQLGATLPRDYLELLARHNGIDWNGFVLYAASPAPIAARPDLTIAGLIDSNLIRREVPGSDDVVILGGTGDDEHCFIPGTGEFLLRDAVSGDAVERYPSFEAMLSAELERRLA